MAFHVPGLGICSYWLLIRPNFTGLLSISSTITQKQQIKTLEDDDATCILDYPQHSFHIFVLDDGPSNELRLAIETLSESYPNLSNTAQKQRFNFDFKAGNPNHGIKFGAKLEKGGAELTAGLDADIISASPWLRRTVSVILEDSRKGMVGPPQAYYNVPPNDPVVQAAFPIEFPKCQNIRRLCRLSGLGVCGPRMAFAEIGGFPTDTLSEDGCFSVLLLASWSSGLVGILGICMLA
ncbi:hypothetical protein BKA65DRAFT_600885 [Rhexocercosporidium sp. MPI-PUGE-AT-0058]|nr:hypothetical protein BKA65DRAFT_600885 [Rhexocercosporidium sp. MPI-PUGE-AT-0058]